jgi:hypothetical protein
MANESKPDLAAWESAFSHLFRWLEDDRDRRRAVIRADNIDIYYVALYIDQAVVTAVSGFDLPDVVNEALEGMLLWEPPPGEKEFDAGPARG